MTAEQIISVVGLVGFGGILKTSFDFLVATRKAKQDAKQTMKETRYKAIILPPALRRVQLKKLRKCL